MATPSGQQGQSQWLHSWEAQHFEDKTPLSLVVEGSSLCHLPLPMFTTSKIHSVAPRDVRVKKMSCLRPVPSKHSVLAEPRTETLYMPVCMCCLTGSMEEGICRSWFYPASVLWGSIGWGQVRFLKGCSGKITNLALQGHWLRLRMLMISLQDSAGPVPQCGTRGPILARELFF